jgi:hypothetical protein
LLANGYSVNWGDVGQYDAAQVLTYPSALVDITQETNEDDGPHSGAYTNTATMEIRVQDILNTSVQYPHRDLRKKLLSRIDDLKKLFGTSPSLGGAFSINYTGFELLRTDDHFISGVAIVTFSVHYTQDRQTPTNGAC